MTHLSVASFHHAEGRRLIDFWRAEYIEHQMDPYEPEPGTLVADAGFARVTVRAVASACSIEIACKDPEMLPDFRTGISVHMKEFDPTLPPLDWSGTEGAAGKLPPTLATAKVTGCIRHGTSWWRVTLALTPEGFVRFSGNEHWHFRLLRSPDPARPPVWPRLDESGVIVWPEGDDRPTDRVFTVRACDDASQSVSFDIFRHPGAPTSDWAAAAPIGQTVGLMGPGAKSGPFIEDPGERLVVGGDETSAPAILRGLSHLPEATKGKVVLLVGDAADIQPTDPDGPSVHWLLRSDGADDRTLTSAMLESLEGCDSRTRLWFAASKPAARQIRSAALDTAGLPKSRVHSVAYWG